MLHIFTRNVSVSKSSDSNQLIVSATTKPTAMNSMIYKITLALVSVGVATTLNAAVITFDEVVSGATTFGFDGDGDAINDVIFSTTDPAGFNTLGPGPNQSYISEPGLEGTTLLDTDLRVDFLNGAKGPLSFGFALSTSISGVFGVTFEIYDSANTLIGSSTELGAFTLPDTVNPSSFPEGVLSVNFPGLASYGLFKFSETDDNPSRHIIDNFTGTFGSTENPSGVPEPVSTLPLLTLVLFGIEVARRRLHVS
jgi:hypothetical protein